MADGPSRERLRAHNRSVKSEALKPKIPNLNRGLAATDSPGLVYYTGLLTGDYLDDHVNAERTSFDIVNDIFSGTADTLKWNDMVQESVNSISTFLAKYLDPIQKKKLQQVEAMIQERSPQFRSLIRHRPEILDSMPPELSEDQIEVWLSERFVYYESELRTQANRMIKEEQEGYEEVRAEYAHFIEEWNEQGVSKLAQYVVHRRTTLQLFAQRLKQRNSKGYSLEEAIHKLIFPMRQSSDSIPYDCMNLWMIDEKLAYHSYLASDKRLDQLENCDIESQDRPDLLIFNSPFAFSDSQDSYNSIVIIEFKRPMRDDYRPTPDDENNADAKKNPITQVQSYIERIRSGKALNKDGRPIDVCSNSRFYAYIVCDITPSLHQIARSFDLKKTPDEKGYFRYFESYNMYLEIISFDQLLDNSIKRNRMFFEKLNLPVFSK